MRTVKFEVNNNTYDSYYDFGLLLKPKTRPYPSPKTNYVAIEGRSGDVDLTESLTGDVTYENIKYHLEFCVIDPINTWEQKLRTISTLLHGKIMKVIFSEDSDYYYIGRITINELSSNKNIGNLSLDCNFEPYKLMVNETVVIKTVKPTDKFILSNQRKWVMPKVTSTGNIVFKFKNKQFNTSSTTTLQSPDFILKEGDNEVEIMSGTGTLTFAYREGAI